MAIGPGQAEQSAAAPIEPRDRSECFGSVVLRDQKIDDRRSLTVTVKNDVARRERDELTDGKADLPANVNRQRNVTGDRPTPFIQTIEDPGSDVLRHLPGK
jgi:hypothetical protein